MKHERDITLLTAAPETEINIR